ncbi:amine oxidase [Burkholderia sp. A9]|uniref:Amine oxidase n=1 Tax=Burkholderia cepacia GG4 TaxID=1009846 RepID=A0A9W3PC11_BURCE|nr:MULTISPECIES: FAD-dependent oxidoreductase [Burkholderia]AFQ51136.1 amine oxidase [Burkholderia cepacia GG4]KHK59986.1 amine oxidase [Burkholderia sp. A9]
MHKTRIAIVGGGLSGLYAAFMLEESGIRDYVLLEARDSFGGRIASIEGHAASDQAVDGSGFDRFDLGPTWFWPMVQPQLERLVSRLGLSTFEQHEVGDMMVERTPDAAPLRMQGYANSPISMRLIGGMGALTDAVRARVDASRTIAGQKVRHARSIGAHVELTCVDARNEVSTWCVEHVLLAVPPRLAEDTIEFTPPLPPGLALQWRMTPTWMAPHAKYVAIYGSAFWREQGLSGEARSARGPLGEIHDASMPGGSAALFGFFSVPASLRKRVPDEMLRMHCRAQLARLFGARAATPRTDVIKDWAIDPCTAAAADLEQPRDHGMAPRATAASGVWSSRLTGIASEWSKQFPGYVAGAVEAASVGVRTLLD